MLFTIQLIIILICLFYGARKGGIALGLLGGIGLVILVFVFHLQPGRCHAGYHCGGGGIGDLASFGRS